VVVRHSLTLRRIELRKVRGTILGYGLAVFCVAVALGLALGFQYLGLSEAATPLFVWAIVLVTWNAGVGPTVAAVILSTCCVDYFFIPPIYSLDFSRQNLPDIAVFVTSAIVVAWFVNMRRRIEDELRHTAENLRIEVERRTRQEGEIRLLNQELAKRAAAVQASNKELESFAYSISHDLRAPLRHMAGYSELLQKHASSLLDEKSSRYIQTILDAAKRMGQLIDDLLGFSRIGRAETNMGRMNLEQLVNEIVSEIGQDVSDRKIVWKIEPLPACYGDRAMLRMVLTNLISNAVKFTGGRHQAEITIGCSEHRDSDVEIFVKDNGAGFDMRYANKLFGVFQRLHRAEEFEGTGIGLATVQRVVQRHGGNVRAEGAIDQGAVFYFSLPRTREALEKLKEAS
jgi:signal transduction histidine kinase